jgi:hypothetical protein
MIFWKWKNKEFEILRFIQINKFKGGKKNDSNKTEKNSTRRD